MDKEKLIDLLDRQTFAYHEMQPESPEDYTAEYKKGYNEGLKFAIAYIDQLDEPETLSPDWIKDNQLIWASAHGVDYYVPSDKLYGLLMPKLDEPDKVVVPEFVGEWIENCQTKEKTLNRAYSDLDVENVNVIEWLYHEGDRNGKVNLFARAWLAYPNIEVEKEKKYAVKDKYHCFLLMKNFDGEVVNAYGKVVIKGKEQLTEQEIKDYDERYWPFAEEVKS